MECVPANIINVTPPLFTPRNPLTDGHRDVRNEEAIAMLGCCPNGTKPCLFRLHAKILLVLPKSLPSVTLNVMPVSGDREDSSDGLTWIKVKD